MSYEAENCVAHGGYVSSAKCFECNDTAEGIAPKVKPNGVCRTGCPTQDHADYSECLVAARINVDKSSLRP